MDQTEVVGPFQRPRHLDGQMKRPLEVQRPFAPDHVPERRPLRVLRGEEQRAAGDPLALVDRRDSGTVARHPGHERSLLAEGRQERIVRPPPGGEDPELEQGAGVQPLRQVQGILRSPDQRLDDAVPLADGRIGEQRVGPRRIDRGRSPGDGRGGARAFEVVAVRGPCRHRTSVTSEDPTGFSLALPESDRRDTPSAFTRSAFP